MTVLMGALLWTLALSAVALALWNGRGERLTIGALCIHLLLIVLAVVFLFRPEEEIKTGDDPAAYFHMAQTFARTGHLMYRDPALLEVAPDERALFRYGKESFGLTKDHCFWIKDLKTATVAPRFHPAFSLMLSVPVRLFGPVGALWVTPLFALLGALLLAGCVGKMIGYCWMPLTFSLFVIHPTIAWNARCLRPELVTLCLLISGLVPTVLFPDERRGRLFAGGVAGLAAGASVLLHITALYILIPGVLLAAWNTRKTRFWMAWWLGVVCALSLFVAQLVFVSDAYGIGPSLMLPSRRFLFSTMLSLYVGLCFGLLGKGWLLRRGIVFVGRVFIPLATYFKGNNPGRAEPRSGSLKRLACRLSITSMMYRTAQLGATLLCCLFVLSVVWIYISRDATGHVPGLPNWVNAYLSLSDFKGVTAVASPTWSIGTLVGILWLSLGQSPRHIHGRRFVMLFGPASLLAGWMHIYMFETRRMVIAVVPLMIVSLVFLIYLGGKVMGVVIRALLPKRVVATVGDHWRLALWHVAAFAVLAVVAMHGRESIYRISNRRGTLDFFEKTSQFVRKNGDFLLAEYTQSAAPLEHMTGLPLLPLASDYRSDAEYRRAEHVMADLINRNPERRYLFVTPFQSATLPGVSMTYLGSTGMQTRLLERSIQRKVPDTITDNTLKLNIFRVGLRHELESPFIRVMDGSRLGIQGGDRRFRRPIRDQGLFLPSGVPVKLKSELPEGGGRSFVLLVRVPPGQASSGECFLSVGWRDVNLESEDFVSVGEWRRLTIRFPDTVPGGTVELEVLTNVNGYLTDSFCLSGDAGVRINVESNAETKAFVTEPMAFQWLRAQSSLALPTPDRIGHLLLYGSGGQNDRSPATISLRDRTGRAISSVELEQEWSWYLLPYPRQSPNEQGALDWYDLRVEPAWNSNIPGYPNDLGCLLALVLADSYN